MKPILSILKAEGLTCLSCDRVNLDAIRFDEYRDSHEHPAQRPFEQPPLLQKKKTILTSGATFLSILHYFLDGSRRTYKVADLVIEGRFLPVVAGQVGVAVMERDSDHPGRVKPRKDLCRFKYLIAFPDKTSEDDIHALEKAINRECLVPFELVRYRTKPDSDPIDLGVAKIMSEMQDAEIAVVQEMAEQNLLQNDRLLVIDGPLRFRKRIDVVQFRNVLGLSKSFRPSFTVGKGRWREDVGTIAASLHFGERSSAFRTDEYQNVIGMWYVRLRRTEHMANPLQGVVKVECYAADPEERENGIDTNRIDCVSAHILSERNVTPYKQDYRWASHIYPMFMAETYLRSSFLSDIRFRALF